MRERELKWSINEDETLVVMNDEDVNYSTHKLNELLMLGSFMNQQIKEGTLKAGFKETQLSLLESYTTEILKMFDYDSILRKERESKHKDIRAVNIENAELRKQLGGKATGEDIRESLKIISERLNTFWDEEGFQYLKIKHFGGYGLRVELHTSSLSGMWHDTNEKLEEHRDKLESLGFTLCSDGEKDRNALDFTKENIDALKSLLSKYFTDFDISDIHSYTRKNSEYPYLRDITVSIRNFDELLNLPFKTYGEK